MTCPQSPISPRTRTSQNRLLQRSLRHSPQNLSLAMTVLRPKHGAKHTGFWQQNPQAEQQLYTPPGFRYPRQLYTAPGGFECWHWSCKAELWSEQPACRSAKTACQGGCFQNQGWCQGQAQGVWRWHGSSHPARYGHGTLWQRGKEIPAACGDCAGVSELDGELNKRK